MSTIVRKTQPTVADVHVDGPLTNISIAYLQNANNFIADRVFPNIMVSKQSDLYFSFPRSYFNRSEAQKRAPGTESAGAGYEIITDNYFADVWAIHHDIPDQRRANADSQLQPDREATELVTSHLAIRRDVEWMSNYFVAGVWDTDVTPATLWDDPASTPIEDVQTGKNVVLEGTGYEPNVMVCNQYVWSALRDHPDIVDRIKYGQTPGSPALVSTATVAALFELDEIIVSKAVQNTAAEGAAEVSSFVAGKNALLCYRAPSPGLMTPSAGYTFSWNGYVGAGGAGQRISRFRSDLIRSYRVEGEMAFAQKVVSADLGYLFEEVVS